MPVWSRRIRTCSPHARILCGALLFALIGGDPAGILFHNSRERFGWLLGMRRALDHEEATTMWRIAKDEYNRCRDAHRDNCRDPGPPPR